MIALGRWHDEKLKNYLWHKIDGAFEFLLANIFELCVTDRNRDGKKQHPQVINWVATGRPSDLGRIAPTPSPFAISFTNLGIWVSFCDEAIHVSSKRSDRRLRGRPQQLIVKLTRVLNPMVHFAFDRSQNRICLHHDISACLHSKSHNPP